MEYKVTFTEYMASDAWKFNSQDWRRDPIRGVWVIIKTDNEHYQHMICDLDVVVYFGKAYFCRDLEQAKEKAWPFFQKVLADHAAT